MLGDYFTTSNNTFNNSVYFIESFFLSIALFLQVCRILLGEVVQFSTYNHHSEGYPMIFFIKWCVLLQDITLGIEVKKYKADNNELSKYCFLDL